jgi:capsular polysaccharide transport system permease protein
MSDDIELAERSSLRSRERPQRPQIIERAVGDMAESDFRRRPSPIDQFESYRLHKITFIAMVLLPVLATSLYYGLWASDQFASELRFSVRQAQEPIVGDDIMGLLAKGTAVGMTGREPYMVANYVQSRNMVEDLDRQLRLGSLYARQEADFLTRFTARDTSERLWHYWQRMVNVSVDRLSGLVMVRVRAFTPDDALVIATAVQRNAERMIDGAAQRARADALRLAEEDLSRARQRYVGSLLALRQVRESEQTVDPEKTINAAAESLIAAVRQKLALARDRDVNLKILSPSAPQIAVMNQRIRAIDDQIAALNRSLTSQEETVRTAADSISRFEERELNRRFSEKLMEISQGSYERARLEEARQHLYLTTFVEPTKPDKAEYPRRIRMIALVSICAVIVWGCALLLIATVKDHRLVSRYSA